MAADICRRMQNLAMVKTVEELAAKKGATASALALAWVHSQGDDVFPIPGWLLLCLLALTVMGSDGQDVTQ